MKGQPRAMDAALSLLAAGRAADALPELDALLRRDPRHAEAWVQRSLALILLGRNDDALSSADRAVKLMPGHPNAHSYRGSALLQLGRAGEALSAYDRLLALAPKAAVAHYNRANALRKLGRWQEALRSLEQALRLQPAYPDALTVTGLVMQALGDLDGALASFDAALKINPQAADAHFNRALLLLATGRLAAGWTDYEWRLQWAPAVRQGQSRAIGRVAPDWQGQPLDRPLLVIPEQGLGDQIFYAGMLADLQAAAPGSTVCTEPRLLPLLRRSFPALSFTTPDRIDTPACVAAQTFGAQIHLASLGRIYRNDAAGLSHVRPAYLQADATRSAALAQRMRQPGKLTCGLSWVSKNAEFGANKSLSLEALVPVLSLPGLHVVDLQYGDTAHERRCLEEKHGLAVQKLDEIDNFHDIDGLAALIQACDIVVTVSNTTAHLAAALGKPALVLVPASSSLFWYWHIDRPDSPWYPSAVLLRQRRDGDWSSAIATAAAAMAEFSRASRR
ncbi:MAG: hypothetical protein RL404_1717 [Pseudomonadota bacterium]|jgi:tetratricopeptide (TPR) repeat protein